MIIPLDLGNQSYDIIVENGILDKAGSLLELNRKVLVVSDSGVPHEYAEAVASQCAKPVIVRIPEGEENKNFEQFQNLLRVMIENSFTRGDCVVAVGGGVVGDLSGFAASCYMRGIDFYNIPTTLLSQVDSSIGGKTAIDFNGIKNIVGSFYQPKRVLIDPDVLKTLDKRQFAAGMAETIKMAATFDKELFAQIEQSEKIEDDINSIIIRSLLIKKSVVEKDPKENGLRRVLNFGHTVGHAIESFYAGKMLHGECVALGMLPMCDASVKERLKQTLKKYDLPTEIKISADELMPYIMHDKKAQSEGINVVYVQNIGSFDMNTVKPLDIRGNLERYI